MRAQILNSLRNLDQMHLSQGIETLTENELISFAHQLQTLTPDLLRLQRERLSAPKKPLMVCEPLLEATSLSSSNECQGKVGCIVLAGGLGTRLGIHGPKGKVVVSPIGEKTLFQLLFEKVGRSPIALMTSSANHAETVKYLEENSWFGVSQDQIFLFSQDDLPYLDDAGNWLLARPGKIAMGPDGNGHALRAFYQSGIWHKWQQMGIEMATIVPIDNPLANPFDPALIGHHTQSASEITLNAVTRLHEKEEVGLIVKAKSGIRIVEYSELKEGFSDKGLANTNLFCIGMSFIQKCSSASMPWHLAYKDAEVFGGRRKVWKFETFIFDILEHSEKTEVIVSSREEVFAPLKHANHLATVQEALIRAESKRAASVLTTSTQNGIKKEL